jgi:hypothetical protein
MTVARADQRTRGPYDPAVAVVAFVVIAVAALYVATAARDIVVGDPTEFVLVSLTGGVAHAPGYPLLTLVGRAFAALPIDPAPFRISLASVAAGAAAAAAVAVTARALGAPAAAAAAGAVAFAATPVVWRWSVVPEAFALNDLLVTGTILGLVTWQIRGPARWLAAAALAGGFAIAHHQTALLVAPLALITLWRGRDRLRARPWLAALVPLLVVIGFTPYAYVPLASAASPPWSWGDARTLGDVLDLIARRSYGTTVFASEASVRGGAPLARVGLLLGSFTPLEAVLLAAGAFAAWRDRRWYLVEAAVAFLLAGPAFVAYADIDPADPVNRVIIERFFLLPHAITAPLLGLGIALLARLAARPDVPRLTVPAGALAAAAVIALIALPSVDRREDRVARGYGADILEGLERGAILLTTGDDASLAVSYLQAVEGARPDVIHVIPALLRGDWYVRQLRARHPELAIPFDRLTTLGAFVEANAARPIATVGPLVDESLGSTHWLYPQGLARAVRRLPVGGRIEDLARENDDLLRRYHVPALDRVRAKPWERAILGDYARVAYAVGEQYEAARNVPEARRWYQRALSIDPEDAASRRALVRVGR